MTREGAERAQRSAMKLSGLNHRTAAAAAAAVAQKKPIYPLRL